MRPANKRLRYIVTSSLIGWERIHKMIPASKTFLLWKLKYNRRTRSILWLLMTWLFVSPGDPVESTVPCLFWGIYKIAHTLHYDNNKIYSCKRMGLGTYHYLHQWRIPILKATTLDVRRHTVVHDGITWQRAILWSDTGTNNICTIPQTSIRKK